MGVDVAVSSNRHALMYIVIPVGKLQVAHHIKTHRYGITLCPGCTFLSNSNQQFLKAMVL